VLNLPSYALSLGLSLAFGLVMYLIASVLVQKKSS
jgi:hypothetical protein